MQQQDVFNTVWAHFITQGCPLTGMYRAEAGAGCAVGIFIPEEEYSSEIEGHRVGSLLDGVDCPPTLLSLRDSCGAGFLDGLQRSNDAAWHRRDLDAAARREVLKEKLLDLAARYHLEVPK